MSTKKGLPKVTSLIAISALQSATLQLHTLRLIFFTVSTKCKYLKSLFLQDLNLEKEGALTDIQYRHSYVFWGILIQIYLRMFSWEKFSRSLYLSAQSLVKERSKNVRMCHTWQCQSV